MLLAIPQDCVPLQVTTDTPLVKGDAPAVKVCSRFCFLLCWSCQQRSASIVCQELHRSWARHEHIILALTHCCAACHALCVGARLLHAASAQSLS